MLRHLGGLGLFLVAMLDSSPLPTFGGLDILTAILSARHVEPWFYYAIVATAGSVIGAYMTFKAARKAGAGYLERKFGKQRVRKLLASFEKYGTAYSWCLQHCHFRFNQFLFCAAGVLNYSLGRFIAVVAICRGARYAAIAIVASLYGRHFVRALQHPGEYYRWLLGVAMAIVVTIIATVMWRKREAAA
jgi:membrane protein YqaA with SNARE-associated domain